MSVHNIISELQAAPEVVNAAAQVTDEGVYPFNDVYDLDLGEATVKVGRIVADHAQFDAGNHSWLQVSRLGVGSVADPGLGGILTTTNGNIVLGTGGDLRLGVGSDIVGDVGEATASSNAATIQKSGGVITTEALSTAGLGDQDITLTSARIAAADVVLATIAEVSGTGGTPVLASVNPAAGSCVFKIRNLHATEAFTTRVFKIAYQVFKDVAV